MNLSKAFPTQEIGSLPKFSWRTKPFRQMDARRRRHRSRRRSGARGCEVPGTAELLQDTLEEGGLLRGREEGAIVDFSLLYAIRMSETAGGRARRTPRAGPGLERRAGEDRDVRDPGLQHRRLRVHREGEELRQQVLEDGLDKGRPHPTRATTTSTSCSSPRSTPRGRSRCP